MRLPNKARLEGCSMGTRSTTCLPTPPFGEHRDRDGAPKGPENYTTVTLVPHRKALVA